LADRLITHHKGLAEDVYVKVVKFYFSTDFVVVDFKADPRVPLILGRSFLRTDRALIDNEAVTFNLDQTTRYSSTNDKSVNRIDIIDAVCEEYAPELLGFSNNDSSGGNPTLKSEPLTSEFILEEIEAYLMDASDFAIGAVLGQRKMKHFQPIHYASKTMTEGQIHYTTTEKEMLAVVYAFEKFRPY
ncbi:reverse transcriptase domain-containing protein, partial [Tanacetum coccineum]